MGKLLTNTGNRLLAVFLGSADAGACIPERGYLCYCRNGYKYRLNCYGVCTNSYQPC